MCFHEKLCVELADKITAQLLEEKNQTFLKYFQEWGAFIGV
jgi:hypothetical protein